MSDTFNFLPLNTSAPAFSSIVSTTGSVFRLETSSTTSRVWSGPKNRYIRVTCATEDMWMCFGSTTQVAVAQTDMWVVFPDSHVFPVRPGSPGISFLCPSSSASSVNVCLGTLVQKYG